MKERDVPQNAKVKERVQMRRVPPEVVDIVRHTPAHKPGVRDGRK